MVKNVVKTTSDTLDCVTKYIAVSAFMLFLILTFVGVLSRFVFQSPVAAAVELSRLGFVWMCLMGAALAYKRNAHIEFSVLKNVISFNFRKVLGIIISLLGMIFLILILRYSIEITMKVWNSKLSTTGWSNGFVYLPLPISAVCMMVHCINEIIELYCSKKEEV